MLELIKTPYMMTNLTILVLLFIAIVIMGYPQSLVVVGSLLGFVGFWFAIFGLFTLFTRVRK